MNTNTLFTRWVVLTLAALLAGVPASAAQQPAQDGGRQAAPTSSASSFKIVLDPVLVDRPFSGRVYVVLGTRERGEPRRQMGNWNAPPQMLVIDAEDVAVGGTIEINSKALAFPKAFDEIEEREYTVQAIARRSLDSPHPGQGEGDVYSKPARIRFARAGGPAVELRLTEIVKAKPFAETERLKLVEIRSEKLSAFHGREVKVRAGVWLPESWKADAARVYPVVYSIPGFGGDHRTAASMGSLVELNDKPVECVLVALDPTCLYGHSVFADSANNGPWGGALVEELIPAVEKKFRGGGAAHRYVTGVSSGGWSSLWLQVTYPEQFAGVWSHCPDPVDFRDFQRIDLYAPKANMYRDESGARRPLCRQGDQIMIWYDDFVRMETAMGPGGQIGSFEAVFGRKKDGKPEPLFERATGAVDAGAAKTWEPYDIRLVLERGWKELGPKLKGKLHIYAGAEDNFYLEGAVRRLKESLAKLGSDAEVEIVPGMGHGLHRPGWEEMMKTIDADRRALAKE